MFLTVSYHYANGPASVDISVEGGLAVSPKTYDQPPYNGAHQKVDAPTSFKRLPPIAWQVGSFQRCEANPVTIFFPYLPKIDDGHFWAAVSYANQGSLNLEEVTATFVEEDGAEWTAQLPALASRQQRTWLLYDSGSGAVLYDPTADVTVSLTNDSGDLAALDGKSVLFIQGTSEITFLNDLYTGDLDGYLMIGNGSSIVSSYLPRNFDNNIPGQSTDLPLLRSKVSFKTWPEWPFYRVER